MTSPPVLTVFRYQYIDGATYDTTYDTTYGTTYGTSDGLLQIPVEQWQGILRGTHPLRNQPSHYAGEAPTTGQPSPPVDQQGDVSTQRSDIEHLILVLSRDAVCHALDPIKVQVDGAGYLRTLDASVSSLPADVIDLRPRFIRRYLKHHHSWQPALPVLLTALARAGCVFPAMTEDVVPCVTD